MKNCRIESGLKLVRIIERIEKKSCNLIDFLFLSKTLISLTRLEDLVANVKI